MNYTYKKPWITFTLHSAYTASPLVFGIRRKTRPTSFERRRLELEVAYLEDWAWGQLDTQTRKFHAEYTRLAREHFARILRGEMHVCCLEMTVWKTATRLNERGENDYRETRRETTPYRKWR